LEIERIKTLELDIMNVIHYKIHAPTVLDFLKSYLLEGLGIEIQSRTLTKKKEEDALSANTTAAPADPNQDAVQSVEAQQRNDQDRRQRNSLKV